MKLFGYNNIDHRIKAGKHVRGLEATQEPYYTHLIFDFSGFVFLSRILPHDRVGSDLTQVSLYFSVRLHHVGRVSNQFRGVDALILSVDMHLEPEHSITDGISIRTIYSFILLNLGCAFYCVLIVPHD